MRWVRTSDPGSAITVCALIENIFHLNVSIRYISDTTYTSRLSHAIVLFVLREARPRALAWPHWAARRRRPAPRLGSARLGSPTARSPASARRLEHDATAGRE